MTMHALRMRMQRRLDRGADGAATRGLRMPEFLLLNLVPRTSRDVVNGRNVTGGPTQRALHR